MAKKTETKEKENVVKFKSKPTFDGVITKIKINTNDDMPEIHYKKENEASSKITVVKGKENPVDEFVASLQSLDEFLVNVTEYSEDKLEDVTITGVSFKDKGIVIIGQVELTQNEIKSPLNLISSYILYEAKSGSFEVPGYIKKRLEELKIHAVDYINGKTTQGKLPLEASEG